MALAAAAAVVLGLICSSSSEHVDREITIVRPKVSPTPASATTESPTSPTPTPTAGPTTPPILEAVIHDFRFPIDGACLPDEDELMPNAPREYRFGTHEGVDFYEGRCCVAVTRGMPVLAAKTGVVVRADHGYQDITVEEMDALLTLSQQQGSTDAATLDRLRGRQVWVDHGNGIVTRYAHLLSVEASITNGVVVRAGQVLGYVGNSGTPEGISDADAENHLHFEIWVGGSYLGQGLSAAETRRLWERAFAP